LKKKKRERKSRMLKIIIADDSVLMRRNLKSILKQLGYTVIAEAANGQEAVELYRRLKPDVVTMDITMPVMDGIEAVNQIIKDYPDANIIMISALNQKEMVFKAIERGAKYYIIKPFKIDMVSKALEQVLDTGNAATQQNKSASKPSQSVANPSSGYVITNENGVFRIQILSSLNQKQSLELKGTIQGLLSIPNVKVAFDFNACTSPEEILLKIKPFVDQIENTGGSVEIIKP